MISSPGSARTAAWRRGPAASSVYAEGERATCFFVLLSGTIVDAPAGRGHRRRDRPDQPAWRLRRRHPGVRPEPPTSPYPNSVRAVTDCDFWVIGAAEFGDKIREWFPMAMHMLEGLTVGFRASQVRRRPAGTAAVPGPALGRSDP